MPARRSPRTELFALLLAATMVAGLGAAQPAATVAATAPTSEAVAPIAMDAGGTTTCVIRVDHTLWCWGELIVADYIFIIDAGTVGENGRNEPQQIGRDLWLTVSVGTENVCGIVIPTATATSGALTCFGSNEYGQLGVPVSMIRASSTPMRIGTWDGWTSVDVGDGTICAINTGGAAPYCIGRNSDSQFGLASDTNNYDELQLISPDEIAGQIATGYSHTCYVQGDNGAAHCVGDNDFGQVGDGTTTDYSAWHTVSGSHSFASLTLGRFFTCGIASATTTPSSDAGKAFCWGRNDVGQLGDGIAIGTDSPTPVLASDTLTFASLRAGDDHVCGVTTGGALYCWGGNLAGKNGLDIATLRTGVHRIGTASNWAGVAVGNASTCAYTAKTRLVAAAAYCWGDRTAVGNGIPAYVNTPTKLPGTGWLAAAIGGSSRCALQGTSLPARLYCWGGNWYGEVGDGTTDRRLTPYEVSAPGNWRQVAMGGGFTCGISGLGALWCWGENYNGQLGIGDGDGPVVPTQVGSDTDWTDISLGSSAACGVRANTSVWCWGSDSDGQVGNGAITGNQTTPYETIPASEGHTWKRLSFGNAHVCALDTAGALYCWGDNNGLPLNGGAIGDGTADDAIAPVRSIRGLLFAEVSAGVYNTCGITVAGATYCWGGNIYGSLGSGNALPDWAFGFMTSTNSASVAGANVALDSGIWSGCAIRRGGDLWCWGFALYGELPLGSDSSSATPRKAGSGFTSIAMKASLFGGLGGCGIKADTTLWCWGGSYGNLLRNGWPDEYVAPQLVKVLYRKPVAEGGAQITGRAKKSSVLTADAPSFTGTPLPAVTYQWYRCTKAATTQGSSVASGCTKITRATSSTYTLVTADVNRYVRLLITAKNKGGTVTIFTPSTGKVAN